MDYFRKEIDKVKIALVAIIGILLGYIFLTEKSINKIEIYTDMMANYTYMYGNPYTIGYAIPLRVDFIQNDTLYLVTRDVKDLKPNNK